jgi:hypothetical protein
MKKCLLIIGFLISFSSILFPQILNSISYTNCAVSLVASGYVKTIKLTDSKILLFDPALNGYGPRLTYKFGYYKDGSWVFTSQAQYELQGIYTGDITRINDSTIAFMYAWASGANQAVRACLGHIADTTISFTSYSTIESSTNYTYDYKIAGISIDKVDDSTFIGAYGKWNAVPESGMLAEFKIINNMQALIGTNKFYSNRISLACVKTVTPNKFAIFWCNSSGTTTSVKVADYNNGITLGNEVIINAVPTDVYYQSNFTKLNNSTIVFSGRFSPSLYYEIATLDVSSSSTPVWSSPTQLPTQLNAHIVSHVVALDSTKVAIHVNLNNSNNNDGIVIGYVNNGLTFSNVYTYNNAAEDYNNIIPITSNAFIVNCRTNQYCGTLEYILPVELSNFTAKVSKNNVVLQWKTQTEINSHSFKIERKIAKSDWVNIGEVSGAGNSNKIIEYSYVNKNISSSSKYQYRLKMIDNDGTFKYSPIVEAIIEVPKEYSLSQNFPNPFNPETKIKYTLPKNGYVKIQVFSVTGQLVRTLTEENQEAGYYSVNFLGNNLSSGIYIYRLSVNNNNIQKKMIYLK